MFGHELARELLDTAKSDLKALSNMLAPEAFDDRIFGFHAQQAVEKALKAWLDILQGSHPHTHEHTYFVAGFDRVKHLPTGVGVAADI